MNTNQQTTASVDSRKIAIAAGLFYLITHVTSVGAAALYDPILNHAGYIFGSGPDTQALTGVLLEIICALAIVGTAIALYPAVKRWNEGIALGYIALRTLEAGIIAVGVIPLLVIVTLRPLTGTADGDPATLASALVSFYKWTSLVGPGLVCGVNTVLMAYLMYRSRLVPRFIPVLGLVGGPLIFAFNAARMFGLSDQMPAWIGIVVVPIFAWEVTLAIYLIVRGFRASAVASTSAKTAATELLSAA